MLYRYLILGLLMEKPMSGYGIKKYVEATLKPVTNASYGTLYPTLHKLLEEATIAMHAANPQPGHPAKKVYRITRRGRELLLDWLHKPAADHREFLLKLYLGKHLPKQQMLALVTNRLNETEALLAALHLEKDGVDDLHVIWLKEYALSLCEAEMAWLEHVEAQLNSA